MAISSVVDEFHYSPDFSFHSVLISPLSLPLILPSGLSRILPLLNIYNEIFPLLLKLRKLRLARRQKQTVTLSRALGNAWEHKQKQNGGRT